VFNYKQFLTYNLILADGKVVNVNSCPKCGQSHPDLLIRGEQKIIFRGSNLNMSWVILLCPKMNEEFKVRIRRKA
jgi:hypothetical protein